MSESKRAGRPPFQVTPAVLKRVRALASQGLFEGQIASCIGVTPNYLPELNRRHPELSEAIQQGKSEGMELVTGQLMAAVGDRNMTAIIWYLKCHGWNENAPMRSDDEAESAQTISQRVLEGVRRFRADNPAQESGE